MTGLSDFHMKKLCLVIPSLQTGGMERVMAELATYFSQKENVEVHLLLYGRRPTVLYTIPDDTVVHTPKLEFKDSTRFLATVGRMRYLRRKVKHIDPDSILSFGEYWNSFVLVTLLGLSYPIFISDRCSPDKEYSTIHSLLRKILYPRARGVIAQTETAKHSYHKEFRHHNIAVIGNPIRDYFTEDSKKEKIVLSVGRLIRSKNHDKLIELFCKIDKPGWMLVIVGGDALKQENLTRLTRLITDLGAESKVVLAGYSNNTEEYYRQSCIFAFSSSSEGFPNALGEAMTAGLPSVAIDCVAGPSDMITDGENGFLIPVNDYDAFRERLEKLMSDESLRNRLGSKARLSIKEYSVERIGRKYQDFVLGP